MDNGERIDCQTAEQGRGPILKLSKRVQQLAPSPTLAITAKAKALKQQGHDVIGLGAGEPDFNTPEHIIEAAKSAMDNGSSLKQPKLQWTTGLPNIRQQAGSLS